MRNREAVISDNKEGSAENNKIVRHKKKILGYYLSGGDMRYIFNSDRREFNENNIDERTAKVVLAAIRNRDDYYRNLDQKLLFEISPTRKGESSKDIFEKMADDKHQKRILNCLTGGEWDDYNMSSGDMIDDFLKKYPTPMDVEKDADEFLRIIGEHNNREKVNEYAEAMEEFKQTVYGKRYEYFKAMKELKKEAEDEVNGYGRSRKLGVRATKATPGEFLKEKLVVDAGGMGLNKGLLIGDRDRKNEDASYYSPERGVFAVFDGAGGERGAARAAGLARQITGEVVEEKVPKTARDLKEMLEKANEAIHKDKEAGITTGAACCIVEKNGEKHLCFAAAGDSRIYVIRGDRAHQITKDEGFGRFIDNALGMDGARVRQFGEIRLFKEDKIVICSDGVTGDYEKDFIPEKEFVSIVQKAKNAKEAAAGLVKRATKVDDRTAIVVEV